jgi:hypothetical protein
MKTTKFSDCECGGVVSLVNEGSIKYPRLRLSCDTCKNETCWHSCTTTKPERKSDNYKSAYTSLLKEWNTDGKFLNGLKYEYFFDVSFYDTYLVRDKRDRNFGCGWSVFNREDAINLCNILNNYNSVEYPMIDRLDKDRDTLYLFVNEFKIKFINKEELDDVYEMLKYHGV